jgi:hypothetical protein
MIRLETEPAQEVTLQAWPFAALLPCCRNCLFPQPCAYSGFLNIISAPHMLLLTSLARCAPVEVCKQRLPVRGVHA